MITAIESIVLICYCGILQYTLEAISVEVKNILYTGLSKYLTNTTWKTFWNTFQQYYYCCGNSHCTDWFQTAWVSPNALSFSQLKM